MKWLALHIDVSPAGREAVEIMLEAHGIEELVIEDEADFQRFLEENQPYWDYVDEGLRCSMAGKCRVTFYVEENPEGYGKIAEVRMAMAAMKAEHPAYAPLLLTVDGLEDADWENNWKVFYQPMAVGKRLFIVPEWLEADSGDRIPVRLDPGLAFGTGNHATTKLCLESLERWVQPGARVLDLGCGSGILFISALLLGAASAWACDIDPKATDAARSNAALNALPDSRYTVATGDVLQSKALCREIGEGYDVVTANIVADVIIALAPRVGAWMAPEGVFLCSGILDGREKEVQKALEDNGFTILEAGHAEGWNSFTCKRKGR